MKNILIADAGSSKTSWSLISKRNEEIKRFITKGINPVQQDLPEICIRIEEVKKQMSEENIQDIYFYGAGCVSNQKGKVEKALSQFWKNSKIEVESDIIGAGKALFGDSEGIACILGTGSNSGRFKQNSIIQQVPSLGFILGDEGSGAALGKRLLNSIFKKQLAARIIEKFQWEYNLSVEEVIQKVYRDSMPAAYLASFSLFIYNHLNEPDIYALLMAEFDSFFKKNIIPYGDYQSIPVGFVGSISYIYSDALKESAKKYGIDIFKIIKNPMPALEKYYEENT